MRSPSRKSKILVGTILVIAAVNYISFVIVASCIGGDAVGSVNDLCRDGRYFLRYKGELTEVSREVWVYSRIHGYSLFVTHPLAILSVGLFASTHSRRRGPPSPARPLDVNQTFT